MAPSRLRVALVQMNPKIEKVEENIRRADEMTSSLQPGTVDLVCFSEMCFTGYVFPSFHALKPYLETPPTGPTFQFCSTLAKRLGCHVIAGYPERLEPDTQAIATTAPTTASAAPATTEEVDVQFAGNSAALFGPDGCLAGGYRKTNLYEADMPWAQAGSGFTTFDLPAPLNRLSIAICMDLNPNPISPVVSIGQPPHELADFCIDSNVDVLVIPCAWLDSGDDPNSAWDIHNVNYWCHRLSPLWASDGSNGDPSGKEVTVIICNRTGFERGTTFAGTSTILKLERGRGQPEVVGVMRRDDEVCRVWTVEL